jgi:hypothetical protein
MAFDVAMEGLEQSGVGARLVNRFPVIANDDPTMDSVWSLERDRFDGPPSCVGVGLTRRSFSAAFPVAGRRVIGFVI